MWYRLFSKVYQIAAKRMCQDCKEFIERNSRILDLGCGSAVVSKAFQDFFQADVIGVDVLDRRICLIPFKIIDGRNLPFSNKSFDTVLIAYVLHHSEDPVSLLKEAERVTRKNIVVYEDLPEGFISKLFCKFHGNLFDTLFQNKSETLFKTGKEWQDIFKKLGLKLTFQKRISFFLNPVKKRIFVLEKV
jgi:ubiquinone/menaquinone biosynthesis C-methylase UbiE